MTVPADTEPVSSDVAKPRRAARLAAVQAIFQWRATENPVERVLREFLTHRLPSPEGRDSYDGADTEFFSDLVRGVATDHEDLDREIGAVLADGWSIDRLDRVLHAILRAGAFEIRSRPDVPPRVSINEYVAITRAFFDKREAAFVNGVLDRLAHALRADEMGTSSGEEDAPPK